MLDITIGMIKKVIHFHCENHSFFNMLLTQICHLHIYQVFNEQFYFINQLLRKVRCFPIPIVNVLYVCDTPEGKLHSEFIYISDNIPLISYKTFRQI